LRIDYVGEGLPAKDSVVATGALQTRSKNASRVRKYGRASYAITREYLPSTAKFAIAATISADYLPG
jgi:hypothetical protein